MNRPYNQTGLVLQANPFLTWSIHIAALVPPSGREITPADAGVLTCLAHWGNEPIYRLAWSPDQRVIGVASFAGAYLYDTKKY
jgi:hypothetical protein